MAKQEYIPLTIDGPATRELIRKKHRFVKRFALRAGIAEATLSEVLNGKYVSPSEHKESNYQRVLRKLDRAGLLVQVDPADSDARVAA
jgi:hypothetical protein